MKSADKPKLDGMTNTSNGYFIIQKGLDDNVV